MTGAISERTDRGAGARFYACLLFIKGTHRPRRRVPFIIKLALPDRGANLILIICSGRMRRLFLRGPFFVAGCGSVNLQKDACSYI